MLELLSILIIVGALAILVPTFDYLYKKFPNFMKRSWLIPVLFMVGCLVGALIIQLSRK